MQPPATSNVTRHVGSLATHGDGARIRHAYTVINQRVAHMTVSWGRINYLGNEKQHLCFSELMALMIADIEGALKLKVVSHSVAEISSDGNYLPSVMITLLLTPEDRDG